MTKWRFMFLKDGYPFGGGEYMVKIYIDCIVAWTKLFGIFQI